METKDPGYSLREVTKLLGLPRAVVSGLIAAGFVAPSRGPRREFRFTFQDLVVLRTAQGLSEARIPPMRILRSLRSLRAKLPDEMPLAGLRIAAVGDSVVVSEGSTQWRPDDGQYLLQFEVASSGGQLAFFGAHSRNAAANQDWFERGQALEATDPVAACDAYCKVLDRTPDHRDAYVNLGRLMHERGKLAEAALVYRQGLDHCGADATLLFNLAVLEEDLKEPEAAIRNYRAALDLAPDLADAHYNLARLCEAKGMNRDALRHWNAFRKLSGRS